MKRSYTRIVAPLAALAIALGLGACGRAQHVAGAVTGPSRGGAGTEVVSGCPSLIANDLNSAFDMNTEVGTCAQFRANRVRLDVTADATELSLLAMGPCIADDAPTITITSAHSNVFVHGTNKSVTTTGSRLTFGAVLPVGAAVFTWKLCRDLAGALPLDEYVKGGEPPAGPNELPVPDGGSEPSSVKELAKVGSAAAAAGVATGFVLGRRSSTKPRRGRRPGTP